MKENHTTMKADDCTGWYAEDVKMSDQKWHPIDTIMHPWFITMAIVVATLGTLFGSTVMAWIMR